MKKKVLFIGLNFQIDFEKVLGALGIREAARNFSDAVRLLVESGYEVMVVLIRDWHCAKHSSFEKHGEHCLAESTGAAFLPELSLPSSVGIIDLRRSNAKDDDATSALRNTELLELICKFCPDFIVLGGATAQIGVYALAGDLILNVVAAAEATQNGMTPHGVDDLIVKNSANLAQIEIVVPKELVSGLPPSAIPVNTVFEYAVEWPRTMLALMPGVVAQANPNFIPVTPKKARERLDFMGVTLTDGPEELKRCVGL